MKLESLGARLRRARKQQFPTDDMQQFALRLGISRATLQKMEQGDLGVRMGSYYQAAELLGCEQAFTQLFVVPESLFDD
jgi:transcriptional regulator with XRE-family HTH domain